MNIKQSNVWIFVILAIVVAVALYWYFSRTEFQKVETTEEALEVISTTPPVTVETNPVKKVPDLNPVEKINPFKTSNPFE